MPPPTITYCSIVGHAEHDLPRALAFIGPDDSGLWPFDEYLFLIDDQSRDATAQIVEDYVARAQAAGVKAKVSPWALGSFAPAWNRLFADATCDWILHAASDEVVLRAERVRDEVAAIPADAASASVLLRNVWAKRPGSRLTRLTRRNAAIRYEGASHSRLVRVGGDGVVVPAQTGIVIDHFKTDANFRASAERHVGMAQEAVERGEPPRGYNLWLLGNALCEVGLPAEAHDAFTVALAEPAGPEDKWTFAAKRLVERLRRAGADEPPLFGLFVIVKDGARTIEHLCRSVVGPSWGPAFDEYVFVDTGSTDGTIDLLEPWQTVAREVGCRFEIVEVGAAFHDPDGLFDFGAARSFAIGQMTARWRMWLDADDMLLGSDFLWSHVRNLPPEVNCVSLAYDYGGGLGQDVKRIFRDDTETRWVGQIHEQPVSRAPLRIEQLGRRMRVPEPFGCEVDSYVRHLGDADRSLRRNLAILRRVHETTTDPLERARVAYFLGQHASNTGELREAEALFAEAAGAMSGNYLGMLALVGLAEVKVKQGDPDAAVSIAGSATASYPDFPEPWWVVASAHRARGDLDRAALFFDKALHTDAPFRPHRNEELEGYTGPLVAAETFRRIGDIGRAREAVAAVKRPGAELDHIDAKVARQRYIAEVCEWIEKLPALMRLCGCAGSVPDILWQMPPWIRHRPEFKAVMDAALDAVAHAYDPALYARRYAEAFSDAGQPDPAKVAELPRAKALVALAREIAQERDSVRVLAVGPNEGEIEAAMLRAVPQSSVVMVEADQSIADRLLARWRPEFGERVSATTRDAMTRGTLELFDIAAAFEVIEHAPVPRDLLLRLAGMLRMGGRLLVTTPDVYGWIPDPANLPRPWQPHLRAFDAAHLFIEVTGVFRCDRIERTEGSLFLVHGTRTEAYRAGKILDILAPGYVPFDAEAHLRGPLGGSEEAIVHLAPRLAAAGWDVRVWAYLGEDDLFSPDRRGSLRAKDDVLWMPFEAFDPSYAREALLIWRSPDVLLRPGYDKACGRKVAWLHDAWASAPALDLCDAVLVLSESHERAIRAMAPECGVPFLRVENGIDPAMFPPPDESQRNPRRALYMSSPDRGLTVLLAAWPSIRDAVPDATLEVFYGWSSAERLARAGREHRALYRAIRDEVERALAALPPDCGVTWRGGVSHPELHDAMRRAGVWAYPHVPSTVETSCITAMKALACGMWPVTTDSGALPETLIEGTILPGDVREEAGRARFAREVVRAMKGEVVTRDGRTVPLTAEFRAEFRARAIERYDWRGAARRFDAILKGES